MKIPLAWRQLVDNKPRALASTAGVCFGMLLLYMQLGFYDTCFRSSTLVYDQLDFDLLLLSPRYVHLRFAGQDSARRLAQAEQLRGVKQAIPLYVASGDYRNRDTGTQHEIMMLAIDPATPPFRSAALNEQARRLRKLDTAIFDQITTGKGYGTMAPSGFAEVQDRRLEVVGLYSHGAGFVCDAEMLVSDQTLAGIHPGRQLEGISIGLVQLQPGAKLHQVRRDLEAMLPADARVWTRSELEASEQRFFVWNKPLGLQFVAGVLLAVCVCAVVLYQVLAADVVRQQKEYATLKAIGYPLAYLNGIVIQQGVLLAVCGFLPATAMAYVVYFVTRNEAHLPLIMTWQRIVAVLAMVLAMCCVSGWLAARKLRRADPADLY